jgi:hypothetical protein
MDKYNDIARKVIDLIADEWIKQGHNMSGAFVKGLSYEIVDNIIWIYDTTERGYGRIVNDGVTKERIPFTPNKERAERGWEKSPFKTSKYIQGLVLYAKARLGLSDKDAISVAFAIAHKQKAEGVPATNFVEDATKEIDEVVRELMTETIEAWL